MSKISKFFASLFIASAVVSSAHAKNEFFIAANILGTHASHQYQYNNGYINDPNRYAPKKSVSEKNSLGFGFNAGYKVKLRYKFSVTPEIFYDNLNSKAKSFFALDGGKTSSGNNPNPEYNDPAFFRGDNITIRDRYGLKLNFGYQIVKRLELFATAGVARVGLQQKSYSVNDFRYSTRTAPIYGVGMSFNIYHDWIARASYDYQRFQAQYLNYGPNTRPDNETITLHTLKLGIGYVF